MQLDHRSDRKKYNPGNLLTDTGFADDLSLLSNTFKDAQGFVTRLDEAASKLGLLMNEKKTGPLTPIQGSLISRSDQVINQVEDFKCLGSYLSNSAKDILNVRIGCVLAAIRKLDKVCGSRSYQGLTRSK